MNRLQGAELPGKGLPESTGISRCQKDPMQQTKQEGPAGGSGSVEFTDALEERPPLARASQPAPAGSK